MRNEHQDASTGGRDVDREEDQEEDHDPEQSLLQPQQTNKRPRASSGRGGSQPSEQGIASLYDYPRKRVGVACEVCRVRKTKCDAKRPTCSFCSQSGAICEYRTTVVPSR